MSELLTAEEAQRRLGLPSSWKGVPLRWAMEGGELPTTTIARHPRTRPARYVTEDDARTWLHRRHYVEGDPKVLPGYWIETLAPDLWDLALKIARRYKRLSEEDAGRVPDFGLRLSGTPARRHADDSALLIAAALRDALDGREPEAVRKMVEKVYQDLKGTV